MSESVSYGADLAWREAAVKDNIICVNSTQPQTVCLYF